MIYDWTPEEVQSMNISEDLIAEQHLKLIEIHITLANLYKLRAKAWLNMGRRQADAIKIETQEMEIPNV